ncbi:leucine Rich Repeat [Seminavis robusta]|uniref:Leucine Rich Repeat n=1 Tax=Seminavis robusta TaxID=568900 RepID=A0A9N8DKI7_9STRA|nr:leucine Rich Repeat [Seminavis robusta]|eukprot:Sro172_g075960.1 leucine Rich Repeat (682) ;mRNA; r:34545-36771
MADGKDAAADADIQTIVQPRVESKTPKDNLDPLEVVQATASDPAPRREPQASLSHSEKMEEKEVERHSTDKPQRSAVQSHSQQGSLSPHEKTEERRTECQSTDLRRHNAVQINSIPGAYFIQGLVGRTNSISDGFDYESSDEGMRADIELTRCSNNQGEPVAVPIEDDCVPSQFATPITSSTSRTKNKFCVYYSLVLYVFLVIGVFVIGSLCASGLGTFGDTSEVEMGTPDSSEQIQTLRTLLERDLGDGYFEQSESTSASSPQNRALHWILNDHPLEMDSSGNIMDGSLLQRFIVALFYFATTEEEPWLVCNPPQGGESDSCQYDSYPESTGIKPHLTTRWLTKNSECLWAGLLCKNGELVEIRLKANRLNGKIPTELVMLTSLEQIDFLKNKLHGSIPVGLYQLQNLERLALENNMLTGTLHLSFFKSNIQRLSLQYNPISGTIPTEVGYFQGRNLWIKRTQISGSIPSELFSLTKLRQLTLDGTKVFGSLPTEIGNMSNLIVLSWKDGLASGTIPSELGRLENLVELGLSNNPGLRGTIPEEAFTGLRNLSFVVLNSCNFSGTLSTNFGDLHRLNYLDIANNAFTGSIPVEMSTLSNLQHICVNGNQLTGDFPGSVCQSMVSKSREVVADCALDKATNVVAMPCECCTQCCEPSSGHCSPQSGNVLRSLRRIKSTMPT